MSDPDTQIENPPHLVILEEIDDIEFERLKSNSGFDSEIFKSLGNLHRMGLSSQDCKLLTDLVLKTLVLSQTLASPNTRDKAKAVSRELQRHLKSLRIQLRRIQQADVLAEKLGTEECLPLKGHRDLASLAAFIDSTLARQMVRAVLVAEDFDALATHEGLNWLVSNYGDKKE